MEGKENGNYDLEFRIASWIMPDNRKSNEKRNRIYFYRDCTEIGA